MQTFLPHSCFCKSVQCLDSKRLNKQRVEALQIIQILDGQKFSWNHHPCVKMWIGYKDALKYYLFCAIDEWIKRGFQNNIEVPLANYPFEFPFWLGLKPVHASHRANLLRKDYTYYAQFGWTEKPYQGYYWPVPVIGEKTKQDKLYWRMNSV